MSSFLLVTRCNFGPLHRKKKSHGSKGLEVVVLVVGPPMLHWCDQRQPKRKDRWIKDGRFYWVTERHARHYGQWPKQTFSIHSIGGHRGKANICESQKYQNISELWQQKLHQYDELRHNLRFSAIIIIQSIYECQSLLVVWHTVASNKCTRLLQLPLMSPLAFLTILL